MAIPTTPKWLSTTLSFILIALLLVVYLVSHAPKNIQHLSYTVPITSTPAFTNPMTIGSVALHVAYATTPAEQEQGLSNTVPLAENQGMLFIFPNESETGFWMKDMNYPLDIIWIGADKRVVDISPRLDPSTYPNSFAPKTPAQYVLEVSSGFAAKNNIVIGTVVSF